MSTRYTRRGCRASFTANPTALSLCTPTPYTRVVEPTPQRTFPQMAMGHPRSGFTWLAIQTGRPLRRRWPLRSPTPITFFKAFRTLGFPLPWDPVFISLSEMHNRRKAKSPPSRSQAATAVLMAKRPDQSGCCGKGIPRCRPNFNLSSFRGFLTSLTATLLVPWF